MKLFSLFLSLFLASTALAAPVLTVRDASNAVLADGDTVDFGVVDVGGFRTLTFTATNEGPASGHLVSGLVAGLTLTMDGANAGDFVVDGSTERLLLTGESAKFSITFMPSVSEAVSKAGIILEPGFHLQLKGTARKDTMIPTRLEEVGGAEVTPLSAPIDFGSPMIGQTVTKTFRLTNQGTAPIYVGSVTRDDPWSPGYGGGVIVFSNGGTTDNVVPPANTVVDTSVSLWRGGEAANAFTSSIFWPSYQLPSGFTSTTPPGTLNPGASVTFAISWSPFETTAKTRHFTVTMSSSVTNSLTLVIPVTGAGLPYVQDPAPVTPLAGLHFRLGLDGDPGNGLEGDLNIAQPEPAEVTLDTLSRWYWSASGPVTPTSPAHSWRSGVSYSFTLMGEHEDGTPYPKSVVVTGASSAADRLGSRAAASFSSGSYMSDTALKLPAADDVGMELWLKPKAGFDGLQCVAFCGESPDAGFGLWMDGRALTGHVGGSMIAQLTVLAPDVWHHAALLMQGGIASLYVDGKLVSQGEAVLPNLVKGCGVGAMVTGAHAYEGQVDELRLFEIPATGFDVTKHLLANAQPASRMDKTSVDFGDIVSNTVPVQAVQLFNDGPGWLRINSASITGGGAADYHFYAHYAQPIQPDPPAFSIGPVFSINLPGGASYFFAGLPGYPASSTVNVLQPGYRLTYYVTRPAAAATALPAILHLETNDPANPAYDIPLTANVPPASPKLVYAGPSTRNWGSLSIEAKVYPYEPAPVPAENSVIISFSNTGRAELKMTASIEGPNAEDLSIKAGDIYFQTLSLNPVQPGESSTVFLKVQPTKAGARLAYLHLATNDPSQPDLTIPIFGQGFVPVADIAVSARLTVPVNHPNFTELASGATLDFGSDFNMLRQAKGEVSVTNVGTKDLTVSRMYIDGPNATDFTLTGSVPTLVAARQGGSTLTLAFVPQDAGPRMATLHVESNDADEASFVITLKGTGLPASPLLRLFHPGSGTGLDADYSSDLGGAFLRLGTAVVKGFRTAHATLPAQRLTLKNEGTAAMTKMKATFTGDTAGDFTATVPDSIATGATGEIVVTFNPTAAGPRAAVLHLQGESGSFDIPVGGTGAYGTKATLSPQLPAGWVGTAMTTMPNGDIVMAGHRANGPYTEYELRAFNGITGEVAWPELGSIHCGGLVRSLCADSAGHLYVGGDFTGMTKTTSSPLQVGEVAFFCSGVARLSPEGAFGGFSPAFQDFKCRAVLALPDGKVLVGGSGSLNGRKNLIRLNADGTVDTTFATPEPDGPVNALALQDDGKVLVGGEFTNLGQGYVPGPPPQEGSAMIDYSFGIIITIGGLQTPQSFKGLCRLNVDGSNDTIFGNPGFSKVTTLAVRGDRIAVGGIETRNYGIWFIIGGGIPVPFMQDVPAARLLAPTGQTLASADMEKTPVSVALQPGDRMLVAPGNSTQSLPLHLRAGVALIQPVSQASDWWGVKIGAATDGQIPSLGQVGNFGYRVQEFDGDVNAILAQPDGKVLVAGGTTMACVVMIGNPGTGPSLVIGGPIVANPARFIDLSPLPEETPVHGFLQLDSDGFFQRPVPLAAPCSDGLSKLHMEVGSPVTLAMEMRPGGGDEDEGSDEEDVEPVVTGVAIDGPAACDYVWRRSGTDSPIVVEFHPASDGPRRAVLHITVAGYDDPFDIALEGSAPPAMPEGVVLIDLASNDTLANGGTVDFGGRRIGEEVSRTFAIRNNATESITTPLTLVVDNADTVDFTLTQAPAYPVPAKSATQFTIKYKPVAGGLAVRQGGVSLSDPARVGYPLHVNFTGGAVGVPVFTTTPVDTLVHKGAAVVFSAGVSSDSPVTWEWFKNGVRIKGANGASLTLPGAAMTDQGTYTVRATNASGRASPPAARLGVMDMQARDLEAALGRPLALGAKVAGAPLGYQWAFNGAPLASTAFVSGIATSTLLLKSFKAGLAGVYTCRVKLGSATLVSPPITVSVAVMPAFVSAVSTPATWRVALPVNESLAVANRATRYTAAGLPPGVVLNGTTGVLSGRPLKAGTYRVRFTAANVAGRAVLDQTVTVAALGPALTGTYVCSVSRVASLNDELGGLVTLTTTSSGAFTGKVRLGSRNWPQAGGLKGAMLDYQFSGSLTLDATGEPLPCGPLQTSARAGAPKLEVDLLVSSQRYADIALYRDHLRYQTSGGGQSPGSLPASLRGTRLAYLVNGKGRAAGYFVTSTTTGATVAWTTRFEMPSGAVALSGAVPVDLNNSISVFGVAPRPGGGQSMTELANLGLLPNPTSGFVLNDLLWGDCATSNPPAGRTFEILDLMMAPAR